jgi:hypothetical protein
LESKKQVCSLGDKSVGAQGKSFSSFFAVAPMDFSPLPQGKRSVPLYRLWQAPLKRVSSQSAHKAKRLAYFKGCMRGRPF